MSDKLMPCPFCGASAELNQTSGGVDEFRWQVGCSRVDVDEEGAETECIAYLPGTDYARKADAIAAWNMRYPQPSVSETPSAKDELLAADIAFDAAESAWREASINAIGDEAPGAWSKEADRRYQVFGEAAQRRKAAIAAQRKGADS